MCAPDSLPGSRGAPSAPGGRCHRRDLHPASIL